MRNTDPVPSNLFVGADRLRLENRLLAVSLDPRTGAISSLIGKSSDQETLAKAFSRFLGRRNREYPLLEGIPEYYDSAKSRAEIDWLEVGPVGGVLRTIHRWPHLTYETRVSLCSGSRGIEVVTRVLAQVPPAPDVRPADIEEGYWLSLKPALLALRARE